MTIFNHPRKVVSGWVCVHVRLPVLGSIYDLDHSRRLFDERVLRRCPLRRAVFHLELRTGPGLAPEAFVRASY